MNPSPLPPDFAAPLARRAVALCSRILWYPEIGSTNDVAAAMADAGAGEGVVIAADAQASGRGRLGRTWASPAGAGIYCSVILRPDPAMTPFVTIAAGVAIADGIEAATGLATTVKWPNDVLVGDRAGIAGARKLAGILAEAGASAGGPSWVVLGFGINVLPAAYPPDVAARATSLEHELGRPVDRGLVLAECLAALSARYGDLRGGRAPGVVAAWRARAAPTFGRRVAWEAGGMVQEGVADDIDDAGRLLVRTASGVVRVMSGEVRWI